MRKSPIKDAICTCESLQRNEASGGHGVHPLAVHDNPAAAALPGTPVFLPSMACSWVSRSLEHTRLQSRGLCAQARCPRQLLCASEGQRPALLEGECWV